MVEVFDWEANNLCCGGGCGACGCGDGGVFGGLGTFVLL